MSDWSEIYNETSVESSKSFSQNIIDEFGQDFVDSKH